MITPTWLASTSERPMAAAARAAVNRRPLRIAVGGEGVYDLVTTASSRLQAGSLTIAVDVSDGVSEKVMRPHGVLSGALL
jgi:hypothetical protein